MEALIFLTFWSLVRTAYSTFYSKKPRNPTGICCTGCCTGLQTPQIYDLLYDVVHSFSIIESTCCCMASEHICLLFQLYKPFFLTLQRRLIVHIHRRRDFRVAHDFLDQLQVRLVFTNPCTERMTEMMR